MDKSLVRQVIDLESKTAAELRELYNELFDDPTHYHASKNQLRPKIGYRLQELALGGLDEETSNTLDKVAKGEVVIKSAKHTGFIPGTKLCREFKGIMHQAEVLEDGFEYNGQKFKSLSAIAYKITGTKWNGPKFFKLRK